MDSEADLVASIGNIQLAGPDMLIDGYEQYNQQNEQVHNIVPDEPSEEAVESHARADDCEHYTTPDRQSLAD
jgi:hypothetical protein